MSRVGYISAFLLGTFLECVMYGVFVTLLIAACYVQWERFSRGQGINRLMAFATVFFGFAVTTNLVISLFVTIRGIVYNPSGVTIQLSPALQFTPRGIAWFMILQFQASVADIIIIYRMYHIYNRNLFVCVIPSIASVGLFAAGCGIAHQFRDPTAPSFPQAVSRWTACSFSLSVFNSLFLTIAISFRLWRVHRQTTRVGIHVEDSIILRVIKVLIESAALWTAFTMVNFFTYLAKSNLVSTSTAMTSPAVGISFCLIIVRLGQILPETRDETRQLSESVRPPVSRPSAPDQVAVSFTQVKIQRDVYVSETEDLPMGTLNRDSSSDPLKIPPSPSPPV